MREFEQRSREDAKQTCDEFSEKGQEDRTASSRAFTVLSFAASRLRCSTQSNMSFTTSASTPVKRGELFVGVFHEGNLNSEAAKTPSKLAMSLVRRSEDRTASSRAFTVLSFAASRLRCSIHVRI